MAIHHQLRRTAQTVSMRRNSSHMSMETSRHNDVLHLRTCLSPSDQIACRMASRNASTLAVHRHLASISALSPVDLTRPLVDLGLAQR